MCGVVSPTDSEQPLQTDPECAARSVVEFVTVIRHRLECQQSLARQLGCLGMCTGNPMRSVHCIFGCDR